MTSEKNFQKKHLGQEVHFSKWRAIFFPIHGYELKKFLTLSFMFFFIIFSFWTLKNLKDTLIITAYGSGAEAINFLKLWAVLPAAIIFVLGYMHFINRFSFDKIFYFTVSFFALFFIIFAFFIYPNREILQISEGTLNLLKSRFPRLQWFFPIYGYWAYTLFYLMAELWGSIVLTLLFWQFSNQICRVFEARRFYAMINLIGSSLGSIAAGRITKTLCGGVDLENDSSIACEAIFEGILQKLMMCISFSGVMVMVIFFWMNKKVLTSAINYDDFKEKLLQKEKNKTKMSLKESLKYIFSSKYIGFMVMITIGFNLTLNTIEVTWKAQLKNLYPSQIGYSNAFANVTEIAGWVTFIVTIIAANVLRKKSWRFAALITPILMLITGGLFFTAILADQQLSPLFLFIGTTPLIFSVWMGAIQQMSMKATKYSLFNATKEMAYIPLDAELRSKGKATVDVMGERFGKTGGGIIQQVLLAVTLGSQLSIAPYLAVVLCLAITGWIIGVIFLNREFTLLTKKDGTDFTKGSED